MFVFQHSFSRLGAARTNPALHSAYRKRALLSFAPEFRPSPIAVRPLCKGRRFPIRAFSDCKYNCYFCNSKGFRYKFNRFDQFFQFGLYPRFSVFWSTKIRNRAEQNPFRNTARMHIRNFRRAPSGEQADLMQRRMYIYVHKSFRIHPEIYYLADKTEPIAT